ncbi:MAG: hypothetical protein K2P39_01690 [Lachnospiraceae bacterium]|nr:hypothetical protein [Lachnospiraceae bacterium]MDE7029154.1 hypothetical protein [Lachnospiraceae bacterium]
MAISPILLNGSIQQTDNVLHNQIKQVEKGVVDQGNIQVQEEKKEQRLAKQVVHADEALFKEERFDAKEKGHNSYSGDGGKRRKKGKGDGKVVAKSAGGFDMKI